MVEKLISALLREGELGEEGLQVQALGLMAACVQHRPSYVHTLAKRASKPTSCVFYHVFEPLSTRATPGCDERGNLRPSVQLTTGFLDDTLYMTSSLNHYAIAEQNSFHRVNEMGPRSLSSMTPAPEQ